MEYVQKFEDYFGPRHMTFNTHLLTHLCRTVRNWGPIWVTTAFPFESWNHKVMKTVSSPKGRPDQIVTRFLMSKFVEKTVYDDRKSVEVRSFISKLLRCVNYENVETQLDQVFIGLGKQKVQAPTDAKGK